MTAIRIFLQSLIVFFNFLCASAAVLVLVGSILGWSSQILWQDDNSDYFEESLQILIGSVLIIASFLGCFGAVNASVRIILLFIALLLLLIGAHFWSLWHYNENQVLGNTKLMLSYTWIEDLIDPGKMELLQREFQCCGVDGAHDYTNVGLETPDSCFADMDESLSQNNQSFSIIDWRSINRTALLHKGCLDAITETNLHNYRFKKWCHVGFLVAEFFGIILANVFIFNITADTLRYSY